MASPPRSPTKPGSLSTKDEISRRGLSKSENATTPITPPTRYIPSNFSTPGSTYGKEGDAIILELSPRCIIAGIEGENHPQCRYDFTPDSVRRVGDYRQYLPNYAARRDGLEGERWGEGYELWRNDLRDLHLGQLSDKLERAVREIYNKHLLVDAGNSRLVLVVPSLLAHPVLETILRTLFERWAFPSISLFPPPATALVAAGLRSGLVVDIGWEETVITTVYEYREVRSHRSTRAMKMLTKNFASWAKQVLPLECRVDLKSIEDFVRKTGLHVCGEAKVEGAGDGGDTQGSGEDLVELEWPTDTFTKHVSLAKNEVRENLTTTLLGKDDESYPDDEEIPLHRLMYKALLLLPTDIRGVCISRIVFIGDGSLVTSFPVLITNAFSDLLDRRGWKEVQGQAFQGSRPPLSELAQAGSAPADAKHDDVIFSDKAITEERYLREKHKHSQPTVHNVIRRVDSLGTWVGASLLTSLKVKSFVEVQRDRYLSHGLSGASRDLEQSVLPPQRMSTLGIRPTAGERTSWTMAGWG